MKSTDRILAQRYARAYDELSADTQQAVSACGDLCAAAAALGQARTYMQDPAVQTIEKLAFVQELFGPQKQVTHFLAVLLAAKRYYLLDSCVQQVQQLTEQRQGIVRAEVQAAFMLTDVQKKHVEEVLGKFTGKTVRAQTEVVPELLGGLRVRIGDTLIDGSLKGRFEKLKQELLK